MELDLLFQVQGSNTNKPKTNDSDSCRTFYYGNSGYVCLRRAGKTHIVPKPEECSNFIGLTKGCKLFQSKTEGKHAKTTDEQQWSKAVEVEDASLSCLS